MPDTKRPNPPCFTFPLQSFVEAKVSLNQRRGTRKIHLSTPISNCLWSIPAPDFSLYKWKSHPPVRNSRESMKPERIKTMKQESDKNVNRLTESNCSQDKVINSRLKFVRSIRPFTAKILFVKYGSFKPDPYVLPKPYDHRGLTPTNESEHPTFITAYDKDPMKLNLLKRTRQQIWGTNCDGIILRKLPNSFVKPLKQNKQWEKDLYLPKDPYPNREKCYTRHRLQFRDSHEVFLDKVSTKLEILWKSRNCSNELFRKNTVA
ncbi:hypothetical protein MN116_005431 [Schistosoma mekongi]|uniref:Uncharacterized protein n=1 Tax=Schistosoma mekongi TaxID=38744 RepID=A0AAE1ZEZ0_SCHME|nr:hypothetical protein MN116_005431 [Schistosoma mekongi]